jgi:hypothetical protein
MGGGVPEPKLRVGVVVTMDERFHAYAETANNRIAFDLTNVFHRLQALAQTAKYIYGTL